MASLLRAPATPVNHLGGVLILNKPIGCTSTVCCRRLRNIYAANRIGHGGTLDPGATGVLPIALNGATRALRYIVMQQKEYRFTVQWGAETDTDDSSGLVVRRRTDNFEVTTSDIEHVLARYRDRQILQVPPQYSALRINGERAHDIARRGEVAPLVARPVRIDEFDIEHHDGSHTSFFARVSRGTYVRALARDIGRDLTVFGHITQLHRSAVGFLDDKHAVTIDTLVNSTDEQRLGYILPLEHMLGMPTVVVSQEDVFKLANGSAVRVSLPDGLPRSRILAVMDDDNRTPVAITELEDCSLKPLQVFIPGQPSQPNSASRRRRLQQRQNNNNNNNFAEEDDDEDGEMDHDEESGGDGTYGHERGIGRKRYFFGGSRKSEVAHARRQHSAAEQHHHE
jgi:tRNA pseudouridine55 synthase